MNANTATYNRCECLKCGSHYATVIGTDEELQKEACPGCGEKKLKIVGPLTPAEISSMFYSGG
jgi:predicted  nucleic acid-binding Zn-ribbon protein